MQGKVFKHSLNITANSSTANKVKLQLLWEAWAWCLLPYSSQSRGYPISQLWTNFESTTSVWASVPSQVPTAKILNSTFKVGLDFFISGVLNWKSPLIGIGIHKGAQFSSLLNKLQFQRHSQLSVTYNCIGNHKSIQKTQPPLSLISVTSQNWDLRLHFCLVLILPHLSHKLMSMRGKKKKYCTIIILQRATASLTKHHPMI